MVKLVVPRDKREALSDPAARYALRSMLLSPFSNLRDSQDPSFCRICNRTDFATHHLYCHHRKGDWTYRHHAIRDNLAYAMEYVGVKNVHREWTLPIVRADNNQSVIADIVGTWPDQVRHTIEVKVHALEDPLRSYTWPSENSVLQALCAKEARSKTGDAQPDELAPQIPPFDPEAPSRASVPLHQTVGRIEMFRALAIKMAILPSFKSLISSVKNDYAQAGCPDVHPFVISAGGFLSKPALQTIALIASCGPRDSDSAQAHKSRMHLLASLSRTLWEKNFGCARSHEERL